MSRSIRSNKAPGFEYWTRRLGNACGGIVGKFTKHVTHHRERLKAKREYRKEIDA